MTPAERDRALRLQRIGITEEHARALEAIWNTRAFGLIADQRTAQLAGEGYSALDAVDAIRHGLEADAALLYMQHGLTPHQAFLLDQHAQRKREGIVFDDDTMHRLLSATLPRDVLVAALLVAESPVEAQAFIDWCTDDSNDGVVKIESLASALPIQIDFCDCDCDCDCDCACE